MTRGGAEKRTHDVRVRLTPTEYARWSAARERSGRKELGAWARATINEVLTGRRDRRRPGDLPRVTVPEVNHEVYAQLCGVANNLNQLARWCNTEQRAAEADELVRLVAAVELAARAVRGTRGPRPAPAPPRDPADASAVRTDTTGAAAAERGLDSGESPPVVPGPRPPVDELGEARPPRWRRLLGGRS